MLLPRRKLATALGVLLAIAGASGASAAIIYVDVAATGAGSGASWADAYTDLQTALNAALPGDEVWVARGVYRPGPPPSQGGTRDVSFHLRSGVALYGGFAGGESTREQRNWGANPTTLSGDLAGDDGPGFENMVENCYQVVVAVDADATAVLDGFVITAGRSDGPGFGAVPASRDQGSGVNIYYEGPRLAHCVLRGNWSLNHGAINDHGHSSSFIDCHFEDNYAAGFGAGLYLHHDAAATVTACTFRRNVSANEGGGLYTRSMHGATVAGCAFTENAAAVGAGAYVAQDGATHFEECTFDDNAATMGGGGLYANFSSPMVVRCGFTHNQAGLGISGGDGGGGGSGGGGIWTEAGAPVIHECTFTDNEASFGGGTYHINGSLAMVSACTFTRNRAHEAGGLYTIVSDVLVAGCTFRENSAAGGIFAVGGGMSTYISRSEVRGCTFIGNTAELGGGGLYTEDESPLVADCVFHANRAADEGALHGWGGAILNGYFTTSTIVNCVFTANTANLGGALYNNLGVGSRIVNCTIVGNEALRDASGGVHGNPSSAAMVENSIVWGNTPGQFDGALAEVRFTLVQGGHAGVGNLAIPPRFVRMPAPGADGVWGTVDDDRGDLRARAGSACMDAGDNAGVPAGVTTDLSGGARVVDDAGSPDIGQGAGPLVDMGALEFQGTSCRADFDESQAVNSGDFFAYLAAFFAVPVNAEVDFNRDGRIDSGDFFAYLAAFFAGCP